MIDLEQLERDARRPDRGAKYYKPAVVLALIAEVRAARLALLILALCQIPMQENLFEEETK